MCNDDFPRLLIAGHVLGLLLPQLLTGIFQICAIGARSGIFLLAGLWTSVERALVAIVKVCTALPGHLSHSDSILAGLVLLAGPCAFALNPALDISQYRHTSWKYSDGFTEGTIGDIVQTSDGYLW